MDITKTSFSPSHPKNILNLFSWTCVDNQDSIVDKITNDLYPETSVTSICQWNSTWSHQPDSFTCISKLFFNIFVSSYIITSIILSSFFPSNLMQFRLKKKYLSVKKCQLKINEFQTFFFFQRTRAQILLCWILLMVWKWFGIRRRSCLVKALPIDVLWEEGSMMTPPKTTSLFHVTRPPKTISSLTLSHLVNDVSVCNTPLSFGEHIYL